MRVDSGRMCCAAVVVPIAARGLGKILFVSKGASPASGRPAL